MNYFSINIIKFVLGNIPIFDAVIYHINQSEAVVNSSEDCKLSTRMPLKMIVTEHQYILPLFTQIKRY